MIGKFQCTFFLLVDRSIFDWQKRKKLIANMFCFRVFFHSVAKKIKVFCSGNVPFYQCERSLIEIGDISSDEIAWRPERSVIQTTCDLDNGKKQVCDQLISLSISQVLISSKGAITTTSWELAGQYQGSFNWGRGSDLLFDYKQIELYLTPAIMKK